MATSSGPPSHDAELQAIAEAAARALDTPLVTVSVVHPNAEWIRAAVGVARAIVPRESSLAVVVQEDREAWYPAELHLNPRFSDNPVVRAGGRRGAIEPIRSPEDNSVLGALGVFRINDDPFNEEQHKTLADLARQAGAVLDTQARSARFETPPPPRDAQEERLRETASFPLTQSVAPSVVPRAWTRAWPWVGVIGLLATSLLTALSHRSVSQVESRHLAQTAHNLASEFAERVATVEQRLEAAVRMVDTEDRIPRGWPRVLLTLNPSSRPEGRLSVGFAAYVPVQEAASFEAQARDRVAPRFVIKPRGTRPMAAPVLFFDPPLSDSDVLGFDLLTDATLTAAIEAAKDGGSARLSDRSSFGRTRGADMSLVLFLPVYDGEPDPDVQARRRATRGFLLAPLSQGDLGFGEEDALVGSSSFSLYSGDPQGYESLLFGSGTAPVSPGDGTVVRAFDVAGRRFSLVVAPSAASNARWLSAAAFWVPLFLGLLATLFAALHVHNRNKSRGVLRDLDKERAAGKVTDTRVKALVDHVVEAIVTYDADGIIQTYNRAAEAMFGYAPSAAIGKRVDLLLPRGSIGHHQTASRSELTGLRASGAPFIADVSVVPVADAKPALFVAVISDITDKRVAEKQLGSQMALTRVLAESTDLDRAAPAIIRSVAQGFDGTAGALWLVSALGEQLDRFAVWSRTPHDERALRSDERSMLPGRGLPGRVWITAQPSRVVDRRTLNEDGHATVLLTTRLALPLIGKKGVVGVLEFVTPRFDPNLPKLDAMLGIVGREVGQFIERKRTEAALVESEARYRELFETAHDLIQSADADGRVLFANRAWRETLGYEAAEVPGLSLGQVMTAASRESWTRALASVPSEGASLETEVVFLARDGREIVADGSLTTRAVRGALSTLGIFRNVTAQKEVERLKQEFVSTVSHELRTPLASIQGSLGLLATGAMGSLPKEAGEVVAIAERNVVRLLGIINDILDLERLQSGRLNMTLTPTRMSGVVDRSIEALKGFVDQKQIRFDVLASSGRAFVDADRIVQVLVNLLSNAAKFSPRATTVSVASMEAAGWVKVSVRDEGPGIPVLYHSSIFERFRQVTSPERPSKGGTGLGLAICKTIVEAHGGTIGVESEEGHGSTFWFHVPAVSVDLDEAAAHRSAL